MKIRFLVILLAVMLLVSACGKPGGEETPRPTLAPNQNAKRTPEPTGNGGSGDIGGTVGSDTFGDIESKFYSMPYNGGEIVKPEGTVIVSLEQLKQFMVKSSGAAVKSSNQKPGGDSFSGEFTDAMAAYDEAFFNDKVLVVLDFTASSGSSKYEVAGVEASANAINVKVSVTTPDASTAVMTRYIGVFELARTKWSGQNNVVIETQPG